MNDCSPAAAAAVAHPTVRHLPVPTGGKSHALNVAIRTTPAERYAFVDDDVELDARDGYRRMIQGPIGHWGVLYSALGHYPKPMIAAVNGVSAGAGFSLALAADIRIASTQARFISVFIRRGLVPDTGTSYHLPQLIGRGRAIEMMMTGDEILDSGVQVMAQPPGKKNQTIHLLSGGEKALTAIALVFAIFQLNPAPFCLLDEVDAPLDDANTERYAKLVASMGKETQFLFISHNKIAMEMAEQLIGVTMQEQGVSRVVAVDMESALKFVDA